MTSCKTDVLGGVVGVRGHLREVKEKRRYQPFGRVRLELALLFRTGGHSHSSETYEMEESSAVMLLTTRGAKEERVSVAKSLTRRPRHERKERSDATLTPLPSPTCCA